MAETPKNTREALERKIRELEEASVQSRRAEQEIAILAEIGCLIGSTLNIGEVYERFAAETQKLIRFDSITVNLYDPHEHSMHVGYVSGVDIDGRRQGDPLPLEGTLSEAVMRTRMAHLIQPQEIDEEIPCFPRLAVIFKAGLRSIICVPLVYRDEAIGALHIRSKQTNAYTERDLHLAERIGIQIAGAIASAVLYNQRRQAEEALRESKRRFESMADTVPVMLYDVAILPDSGRRFLYVAPQPCREILELDPEDLLADANRVYSRIHPEDIQRFWQEDASAKQERRTFSSEVRLVTPSGRLKWVTFNSKPNPVSSDEPEVWSGFIQDISKRKRAEAQMVAFEAQYQQLQKAESLGRMAGAIAHNFNNLLGAVLGNLELAMREFSGKAGVGERLTRAFHAAKRAAEVSGLMLTYLGQAASQHELLDLSGICRRSLPILRAAMPKTAVLEINFQSPGPNVKANGQQIRQVLTNLATNGWEALGQGRGTVGLRTKTVSPGDIPAAHRFPLDWRPQALPYACLEVTDSGCGIAEKDIENLFDPFFTRKFPGRGLGLSVVLGIVRAHGGAVSVESREGQGSTLRVFLPVTDEEVLQKPEKTGPVPPIEGGGTVLLIEDEAALRETARDMLAYFGFEVVEAGDGAEAQEVFRRHRDSIRFVLCDLTMPRMNGWETLAALRRLAPGIPVILASGYDRAQVMTGDHPEWPQAFLGKPYQSAELHDAICQALERKGEGE